MKNIIDYILIGIFSSGQAVLVTLKLVKYIDAPWLVVLLPLLFGIVVYVVWSDTKGR